MFLIYLNAEIVAYILSFRKSRHKPNLEKTSKYGFSPDLGEKNGGVLSMRMQVILDSSFARPGSVPIAILTVTSPIVINVPTRGLLAVETKDSFVLWLAKFKYQKTCL